MKKFLLATFIILAFAMPCMAYHIEVLQVSNISVFDDAYNGFVAELKKNGIIEGQNLVINRHIIDADADAGTWQKVKILLKIKSTTSDIVASKPDLVMTISTVATKYSKDKIISAGIPLVFNPVAIPEVIGCKSKTEAAKGMTGSTIYMDPKDILSIMKLTFPKMKTIGMVYSDDDNAVAFAKETVLKAKAAGLNVLTKQVGKSEKVTPSALELLKQGVDVFIVPMDTYYAVRNYEASKDISKLSFEKKIPVVSTALAKVKGPVLYIAKDWHLVGSLAGRNAVKILKEKVAPETLPIGAQEDLNVYVDLDAAKNAGVEIPMQVLQVAKEVKNIK